MILQLWQNFDECSTTMRPPKALGTRYGGSGVLIKNFYGKSYYDVKQQIHQHLGWEPWRPFSDDDFKETTMLIRYFCSFSCLVNSQHLPSNLVIETNRCIEDSIDIQLIQKVHEEYVLNMPSPVLTFFQPLDFFSGSKEDSELVLIDLDTEKWSSQKTKDWSPITKTRTTFTKASTKKVPEGWEEERQAHHLFVFQGKEKLPFNLSVVTNRLIKTGDDLKAISRAASNFMAPEWGGIRPKLTPVFWSALPQDNIPDSRDTLWVDLDGISYRTKDGIWFTLK